MKIHIVFNFKSGPWGGGNQFLKLLRIFLIELEVYTNNPKNADVILFNSHHDMFKVIYYSFLYRDKIFIHRIDGPINLIRKDDNLTDKLISSLNDTFADATIFQSNWSFSKNLSNLVLKNKPKKIILNSTSCPFVKKKESKLSGKVKIIATSWSSNYKKGFDIYSYLDKNLDFSKYDFTFVGNSKIKFKNITHIPPQDSISLSKLLREHDVFITASRNDPCSNSLIEGLASGLPAIGLNSGGHPEIIKNGGLVFEGKKDVIDKIEKLVENYDFYKNNIDLDEIDSVAKRYVDFATTLFLEKRLDNTNRILPKHIFKKIISFIKISFYNITK